MDEMKLLAGHPIYVDKIPIYSPKLTNIALVDEQIYNLYSCLCFSLGVNETFKFPRMFEDNYDNIAFGYPKEVLKLFYSALEFFTGQNFIKKTKDNQVYFESEQSILYKNNYQQFVNTLKLVNCMDTKNNTIKHNNELDKKIEEAKKKINQKLNKGNENNEDDIRLMDLISVLASTHNNLNIMNIWDLNIYQFNNQFKRMQLIENHNIGIRQLLAGVDKKHVQLEHYIKKI